MKNLFDQYLDEWTFLTETMQTIDSQCESIFFQDLFFLPENMLSVPEYLVREEETDPD